MSPEFTSGAEFAESQQLDSLFDQVKKQLSLRGERKPYRTDVERAADGLAVVTDADIKNGFTGAYQVRLSTTDVGSSLPTVADNLELDLHASLDIWYNPEHYFESSPQAVASGKPRLTHIPTQIGFMLPKNEQSIYTVESIILSKKRIGKEEIIQLERDQALDGKYYFNLDETSVTSEDLNLIAQFNTAQEDYEALTKQEVGDLMSIVNICGAR